MTVIMKGKTGWNVDVDAYLQEIINARGTAASLDARMDVAINEDGTLKTPTPGSGWWTQEADAVAYVSATSCTVGGDKTAIYLANRAFQADVTAGTVYSYVVSATYDSGTGLTTVTIESAVLDSGLSAVYYGQVPESSPALAKLYHDVDVNGYDFTGIVGMPNQSACSVYLSSNQSVENTTSTKININYELYDVQNEYDNATNFRFTATKAGKYLAQFMARMLSSTDGALLEARIVVNGTVLVSHLTFVGAANSFTAYASRVLNLAAGDYVEAYVYQDSGASQDIYGDTNNPSTYITVTKLA